MQPSRRPVNSDVSSTPFTSSRTVPRKQRPEISTQAQPPQQNDMTTPAMYNNYPPSPSTSTLNAHPAPPPQRPSGSSRPLSYLPSFPDRIDSMPISRSNSASQVSPTSQLSTTQAARSLTLGSQGRVGKRPVARDRRAVYISGQEAQDIARTPSFGSVPASANAMANLLATSPGSTARPIDTAQSSFPLNNNSYESSTEGLAQELSNLQALRRMSMNVDAAGDPDLPVFSPQLSIPSLAPTNATAPDDEASKIFWVPARLHPELAPKEFKTFLDEKVKSIKRRSEDFSVGESPSRSNSGTSLRREKSMLSRQIDTSNKVVADNYQDGAERLERKRSQSNALDIAERLPQLGELEMLVSDPEHTIGRLSLDSGQTVSETLENTDMPIIPAVAPGNSLRRSTRTNYGRGSLKRGAERKLAAARAVEATSNEQKRSSTPTDEFPDVNFPLVRVQSEPIQTSPKDRTSDETPRDAPRVGSLRRTRGQVTPKLPEIAVSSFDVKTDDLDQQSSPLSYQAHRPTSPPTKEEQVPVQTQAYQPQQRQEPASYTRQQRSPPPQPPQQDLPPRQDSLPISPESTGIPRTSREPKPFVSSFATNGRIATQQNQRPPQQSDLAPDDARLLTQQQQYTERRGSGSMQTLFDSQTVNSKRQQNSVPQTIQHMAANPSPLPGNNTRTDMLSFIPTLTEEKRPEPYKTVSKKRSSDGMKKSSWSWGSLLGTTTTDSVDKEREKEKERERERKKAEEELEFRRNKAGRPSRSSLDNARLDVLQTTLDGSKQSRESLVLDRSEIKLEDERAKTGANRKVSSEVPTKKEKEAGLFSSLFGAAKRKTGHGDPSSKKLLRPLSPEPRFVLLRPDVDYNWTRFSILEERAIYRMAHLKLANPRRALYSQVLLSNFMYSYLAKVQQMHPQMQIPQSAAQKNQQRQQALLAQQQAQQAQQTQQSQQSVVPESAPVLPQLNLPSQTAEPLVESQQQVQVTAPQQYDAYQAQNAQPPSVYTQAMQPIQQPVQSQAQQQANDSYYQYQRYLEEQQQQQSRSQSPQSTAYSQSQSQPQSYAMHSQQQTNVYSSSPRHQGRSYLEDVQGYTYDDSESYAHEYTDEDPYRNYNYNKYSNGNANEVLHTQYADSVDDGAYAYQGGGGMGMNGNSAGAKW